MRSNLYRLVSLFLFSSLLSGQASAQQQDGQLLYVVYVSRHGVRSPTSKASQYDRYSAVSWPSWSVDPGYLTPHGYDLIKLFGAADRASLSAAHLLAGTGCDDASHITIHADSDQRTRETAKALAEGLMPGCNLLVNAKAEGTNDPLFHLPPSQITSEQSSLAATAILGRIGGDPTAIAGAYKQQLSALDDVLGGCGKASPSHPRTSLLDIPATIAPGSGDHIADMRGPLSTAATLSEVLLLEYADNKPQQDVGWGCVDAAKIRSLIDLHTASFDIAQRTPAVAVPQSAALLRSIAHSLEQAASHKPVVGAEGKPEDKALFLVGHDTNLANIAGALHLDWLLDGRRNDTPPGATLAFELHREAGHDTVRLYFTAQTLNQMREASEAQPPHVPVFIPGCTGNDGSCDLQSFLALIQQVTAQNAAKPVGATTKRITR
jgi:4-phytase/acid phosphatase